MSERNSNAASLRGKSDGSLPAAHGDFPDESRIWRLMEVGFTYAEACDLSPDESDRYLAVAYGWRSHGSAPTEAPEPQVRKATQADIDALIASFGG